MTTAEGSSLGHPTIRVSDQALTLATRHAVESGPKELGGILVGWWEGQLTAVVHELVIVPDDESGWNHYVRSHRRAQKRLSEYVAELEDPRVGYVGEWHSHPAPHPPSGTDRAALGSITRQSQNPVALIVLAVTAGGEVTPHALIGRARWPRRRILQQATIERMTP